MPCSCNPSFGDFLICRSNFDKLQELIRESLSQVLPQPYTEHTGPGARSHQPGLHRTHTLPCGDFEASRGLAGRIPAQWLAAVAVPARDSSSARRLRSSRSSAKRLLSSRTIATIPLTLPSARYSIDTVKAIDSVRPSWCSAGTRSRSAPYLVTPVSMVFW